MTAESGVQDGDAPAEAVEAGPLKSVPCKLGEYTILKQLGDGGLACVYLAEHQETQRQVALKIMKPEAFADDSESKHIEEHGVGHLVTEFKIGSQFQHPNVITTHSLGEADGICFLKLEAFSPRTFDEFVMEGKCGELVTDFKVYVVQMALALQHIHQAGWVHCDIKLGNFLFNDQHEVKLIDFAYAHPIYIEGKFQRPLNASGTNAFMSPEQKQRWPLDARSDIYSFGRTLYLLATGQLPFAERRKMTSKQMRETPVVPDAHRVNPKVSREFADLLIDMMEEVSVNRPSSMDEFLERFQALEPFES